MIDNKSDLLSGIKKHIEASDASMEHKYRLYEKIENDIRLFMFRFGTKLSEAFKTLD